MSLQFQMDCEICNGSDKCCNECLECPCACISEKGRTIRRSPLIQNLKDILNNQNLKDSIKTED